MKLDDWRNLPSTAMTPVYEAERLRWAHSLQWDLAPTLRTLERARANGTLPGLVVRGPGQSVVGWSYFLVQHGVLQVGALHARTADGVRLLLDAIFKTPEASLAHEALLFVYPDSPACESALQRRRFAVTRYWYMRRMIDRSCVAATDPRLQPMRDLDGPDVVRLLSRAYAGVPAARCFAPHGRIDEWAQYLSQLTHGTALGRLVAEASLVAPGDQPGRLHGAAVVTDLSASTLHLAQLAVDPGARRGGLGARMLDAMLAFGLTRQRSVATLLVSEDNLPARALYDARGFVPTGYFLHAERPLGRRVLTPTVPSVSRVSA
ncbi:MAG: GNAT family N-acetyltransferase [Luteitalea sp.]